MSEGVKETEVLLSSMDFYLSSNGYLVFPKLDKRFLVNLSESTIPDMPEAVETTVKIAGRDGEVSLDTTYNSLSFELVIYTEDGLTPIQKEEYKTIINKFFNEMKKKTKTFAFEAAKTFYKVKYSGAVLKENFPQHLRFNLPFKSSKSYGYKMIQNVMTGNSKKESDTIEPTGFECIIKGPALKPIISLNDYSIEYSNTILEGESLIIDSNNSTVVLENSEGTKTNAMRYYNHQFPKILTGENELKVLSGIDNPENVSISWYDLTL